MLVNMLQNTFLFIPGVGPITEEAFWRSDILDWDVLIDAITFKWIRKGEKGSN